MFPEGVATRPGTDQFFVTLDHRRHRVPGDPGPRANPGLPRAGRAGAHQRGRAEGHARPADRGRRGDQHGVRLPPARRPAAPALLDRIGRPGQRRRARAQRRRVRDRLHPRPALSAAGPLAAAQQRGQDAHSAVRCRWSTRPPATTSTAWWPPGAGTSSWPAPAPGSSCAWTCAPSACGGSNLGGAEIPGADGLARDGRTLYVVNSASRVTALKLSKSWLSASLEDQITSPRFRFPTTVAVSGRRLLVVNSQFNARGARTGAALHDLGRATADRPFPGRRPRRSWVRWRSARARPPTVRPRRPERARERLQPLGHRAGGRPGHRGDRGQRDGADLHGHLRPRARRFRLRVPGRAAVRVHHPDGAGLGPADRRRPRGQPRAGRGLAHGGIRGAQLARPPGAWPP